MNLHHKPTISFLVLYDLRNPWSHINEFVSFSAKTTLIKQVDARNDLEQFLPYLLRITYIIPSEFPVKPDLPSIYINIINHLRSVSHSHYSHHHCLNLNWVLISLSESLFAVAG